MNNEILFIGIKLHMFIGIKIRIIQARNTRMLHKFEIQVDAKELGIEPFIVNINRTRES